MPTAQRCPFRSLHRFLRGSLSLNLYIFAGNLLVTQPVGSSLYLAEPMSTECRVLIGGAEITVSRDWSDTCHRSRSVTIGKLLPMEMRRMAYVIRERDPTTTGGKVIAGSSTTTVEYRKIARITDPVWCPVCKSVGYIAEGHNTWLDNQQAVAVEGCIVQCGCPVGNNRLVATQSPVLSDNQPFVPVPPPFISQVVVNTHQWAEAIRLG